MQNIINKRYGLRCLLRQKELRDHTGSIKECDLSEDKEPEIRGVVDELAKTIAATPSLLFDAVYDSSELAKDYESLVKKKVNIHDGLDSRSRPGHLLLDSCMPHFWEVENWKGRSVKKLAENEAMLKKALWSNLKMHSTPYASEIRRSLIMVGGLSNVTKYRAAVAKAVYQWCGAKRVLDPCVGWGGRLLGAVAAGADVVYHGAEPCSKTFGGLQKVVLSIPKEARDRVHISNKTGEEYLDGLLADETLELFDVVLTSPPYYNLELYSKEATQSVEAHPSWEEWLVEWLEPLVARCLALLKEDGTSCWSVKNFKTDREYNLADEVKKIHEMHGWTLVETVKLTGSARPGGGRIQGGEEVRSFEEETFCFRREDN
jgi:hypothetical protein